METPSRSPRSLSALVLAMLAVTGAAAQQVIVDNSDTGFSILSESWLTANVSGQFGGDYRYRTTGLPAGTVEWRPNIATAGLYQVAVWYRNGNDRPSNATYTIEHAGGSTNAVVDQRINGSVWVTLGSFNFNTGNSGRVTLSSNAEPGKTIIVDAVRFLPLFSGAAEPELRACWLTQYQYLGKTEPQLRAIAQNMRAGTINTVYIAMYSGGTVYWPSTAYKAAGGNWGSSSIDYAAYLTRIFKEEGLKVGAWFEYGFALGAASHPIAVAHPDWLARDRFNDPVTGENGGFVFMSPGHPQAVGLLVAMCRELAENYNFDDIQIDRYRWGRKSTGREYGYEAVTAAAYQAQFGSPPPTNVNQSNWVTFRENLVNASVEACYDAIKAANPEIVVSSAPVGSYGITQHMQRWSSWVNGGYLDLCMPQMYMTSLSSFQTEFNTQYNQAPAHRDKLAVGFRAQEDADWTLVRDQMNFARASNIKHGTLWVYHQYTTQIAIQDEINNLPLAGQPWNLPAYNPFVSDRMLQIVIDNRDGSPSYIETPGGVWANSAQPGFFRFDSRVVAGGAGAAVEYRAAIPKTGRYDVYAWHTSAGNRNNAAAFTIDHYNGSSTTTIDQTTLGGMWNPIGRHIFTAGPLARRVLLSTADSDPTEFTSADAVKLVLTGYALGDADGDADVDGADFAGLPACISGPIEAGGVSTACEVFDFDDDSDADMLDFAAFQAAFGN